MNEPKPSFFAGRRVGVFFKGGRLVKDKKTDIRYWRLKWAITVEPADAYACRGAIQSTYEHIQARENAAEKIELAGCVGGMLVTVYPTSAEGAPHVLRLGECFLDKFSMTWGDGMTEFWLQCEHQLTDQLHAFVKDYSFQRFWVEFEPAQQSLGKLASEDGGTISVSTGGKTVTFKPKGPVQ